MATTPVESPARSAAPRPPLVPGVPVLGNAIPLAKNALGAFIALYHRMGPAYRVKVPGRRYTVLSGPKAADFLLHGGERYLTSEPIYRPLANEIGTKNYPVVTNGARHHHLRRVLKPAFSREAMSYGVPRLAAVAREIVSEWQPGALVRLPRVMRRIVAEQVADAMTNRRLGPHLADAVLVARVSMGAGLGAYPGVTVYWPPYRRARRRLQEFLHEIVAQHRAAEAGRQREADLVDVLLAATDVDGGPLPEHDVVVNTQMLFATTILYSAPAAACLLYALLREPAVLEQVQAEVDEAFAEGPLDMARLKRMRVLQAALRESMRLYPAALTVPRVAREPFEFEGYRVDAGDVVLVATSVAHFLPENFPDPYAFDVTRFWEPRSEHRRPGAWVPFGLGARPCLGAGLVEIMVMATIATILHAVRLRLDPADYQLRRVVNPFPEPEEKLAVRVVERRAPSGAVPARRPADEPLLDLLFGLDREHTARIASRVQTVRYEAGDVIVRQDDAADRFYMLADGEVEVLIASGDGERVVRRLGRGEYFGEIGLLQNVRRTASVRAATAVTVLALEREAFLEMVAENDLTASEINRLLRQRLMTSYLATALPRLDREALGRLLSRVETLTFPPGTSIVRQGDAAERFYIVIRGRVEVVNHHPGGSDITLAWLGPGEYFGEIGLLQGARRTATVRAGEEAVDVLALERDAFDALLRATPGMGDDIGAVMASRLAANNTRA